MRIFRVEPEANASGSLCLGKTIRSREFMGVDDVRKRYDAMIRQIAEMQANNAELATYLRRLTVNREEWDDSRVGGHFYFDEASEDAGAELIDAIADDADGATIAVTLHLVGSRSNWAEWYRWDGEPVLRWPPPSVRPLPDA